MDKWMMIMGAGYDQIPMLEKARSMGLKVVAVDGREHAPGAHLADAFHRVEVLDIPKVLEIARARGIAGITTMVSNLGMRTVAVVADRLGLPSITPQAATTATDKAAIKEALSRAGVACPRGSACADLSEAMDALTELGLPLIVKPADGTKGRGIAVVRHRRDFAGSVEHAFRWSGQGKVIIEEWLEGPTVGAECLIVDGEADPILITDKFNTEPPWCVTIGLTTPSRQPDGLKQEIEKTAKAVTRALGLTTGAAHIDMVVHEGIPKVVDVGPRLASGPVVFDFAPRLMGVDMIGCVIQMALGERPVIRKRWSGKFGASRFVTAPEAGCMFDLVFPAAPRRFAFYPYKPLGTPVAPPRSDSDRLGCVAIVGDTYEDAWKQANALLAGIQVRIAG